MEPANQTAAWLSMVPVLPIVSRPRDIGPPVRPEMLPSTTLVSTAAAPSATLRVMACSHFGAGTGSSLPSRSTILVMTRGLQ